MPMRVNSAKLSSKSVSILSLVPTKAKPVFPGTVFHTNAIAFAYAYEWSGQFWSFKLPLNVILAIIPIGTVLIVCPIFV